MKKQILWIDDVVLRYTVERSCLVDLGVNLHLAPTLFEAEEHLKQQTYDLIIMRPEFIHRDNLYLASTEEDQLPLFKELYAFIRRGRTSKNKKTPLSLLVEWGPSNNSTMVSNALLKKGFPNFQDVHEDDPHCNKLYMGGGSYPSQLAYDVLEGILSGPDLEHLRRQREESRVDG